MRKIYIYLFSIVCLNILAAGRAEAQSNLLNRGVFKKLAKWLGSIDNESDDPADYVLLPQYTIIADEPAWLLRRGSYEDFYYNLLTQSVIGNYDLNLLTGEPRNPEDIRWLTSEHELKESGDSVNVYEYITKKKEKNIFLQVSCYGDAGGGYTNYLMYYAFLKNENSIQDTLYDRLKKIRKDITHKYQIEISRLGLILDLQNIPSQLIDKDNIQAFCDFIKNLKREVLPANEHSLLGIKLPVIHGQNSWYYSDKKVIDCISKNADLVIYKNYSYDPEEIQLDYLQSFVKNNYKQLQSDVDSLKKMSIPPSKLIIEFAYLGLNMKADPATGDMIPDEAEPVLSYGRMQDIIGNRTPGDQPDSSCTIYRLPGSTGEYFFDSKNIRLFKYEQLKKMGINGISLYGIGYIKGKKYNDLYWKAVAEAFGRVPDKLFWYFFGTLFGFLSFGFPYSVFKFWQVRNILARYKKYILPALGGWAVTSFGFLFCLDIIPRSTTGVYLGIGILVILTVMILARIYLVRLIRLFKK